jgi:hypothetical protein
MSFSYEPQNGFTLVVLGDIPEWVKAELAARKVEVRCTKERGKVVSLDTLEEVEI